MTASIQYSEPVKFAKEIPQPTGFRLLIAIPVVKEKTEGGIILTDERRAAEAVATIVGWVMEVGPDAYKDKKRFPSGPWCKKEDWIVMRAYSGTRLKVKGQEFRIINDDSVEAVVENPLGAERA